METGVMQMDHEKNLDAFADLVTGKLRRDGFEPLTEIEYLHAYHHGWTVLQTCADAMARQIQARSGRKWQVERKGGQLIQVEASCRWFWRLGDRVSGDYFDTQDDAVKDFIKNKLADL
jgi:hypothetical protein